MKNKVTTLLAILCLILATGQLYAQSEEKATQASAWLAYASKAKLDSNWHIAPYIELRKYNGLQEWQQWLGQVSIHRKLGDFEVAAGYTYVSFHAYGNFPIKYPFSEHRHWEQVAFGHKIGKLKMNYRLRWEHRWLERKTNNLEGEQINWLYKNRWRQRINASLPLGKSWSVMLSDEFFFSEGGGTEFNCSQNRLRTTVSKKISPHISINAGHMVQHIWRRSKFQTEENHTLLLGVSHLIK